MTRQSPPPVIRHSYFHLHPRPAPAAECDEREETKRHEHDEAAAEDEAVQPEKFQVEHRAEQLRELRENKELLKAHNDLLRGGANKANAGGAARNGTELL